VVSIKSEVLAPQYWRIIRALATEGAFDKGKAIRPSKLAGGKKHIDFLLKQGLVARSSAGYYLSSKGYDLWRSSGKRKGQ